MGTNCVSLKTNKLCVLEEETRTHISKGKKQNSMVKKICTHIIKLFCIKFSLILCNKIIAGQETLSMSCNVSGSHLQEMRVLYSFSDSQLHVEQL